MRSTADATTQAGATKGTHAPGLGTTKGLIDRNSTISGQRGIFPSGPATGASHREYVKIAVVAVGATTHIAATCEAAVAAAGGEPLTMANGGFETPDTANQTATTAAEPG